MMQTMMANGGEEPTLFLWNCDRYPYPHPFRLPTTRPIERGDLIICEMHPKFGGYFTHVERTFCLGEPEKQQLAIYDGCLAAYRRGLENFGPGKSISVALDAVKEETDARGAWSSRSTSTCSIRTGTTARPVACLLRRWRSPIRPRAACTRSRWSS